ncbi:hypothetical protein J6N69_01920 [bacterium]|nr:hypothetical protein [bacterium]
MGIGSLAWKALKLIPRYAFSDGASVISKARKATVAKGNKFLFCKDNEFALKNASTKISAGWKALKKDAAKTMNSNKSVWASLRSFGKSLISKPKAGIRAVTSAAAKAGKTAGFWAKTGGALKGLWKACNKLPIIGTLFVIGGEIPDIYTAFSKGGAWEGTKQVLKSSAKVVGFAAGTALGAVVGGPVGALAGGLAADMLVNYLTGGSYSENHPEETEETEQQGDSQSEADTDTSSSSSSDAASDSSNSSAGASSTGSAATGSDTATTTAQQPTTTVTTPFPTPWSMSGFAMGTGMGMGMGMGMFNPFGMGMGMYNPASAVASTLLQPGENIFEKYPMGYKFQYMG